jgi:hypothetical protein
MYSSPAFELFRRGLIIQAVQTFHGINSYSTMPNLGPDWAQDCLNVIVSGSGGLSKFRLPVKLSVAIPGIAQGPNSFWDFQQGNGLRQVLAFFGQSLYYYTNYLTVATLIEANALNVGQWSFKTANNILFGVNGLRAQKWTGANWWLWGIVSPTVLVPPPVNIPGLLSPTFGYTYSYSWKNSVTQHQSNITLPSQSTGPQAGVGFTPTATASPDPQVDTICWFRSLDGGSDQFQLAEVNINTGVITTFAPAANVALPAGATAPFLSILDNTLDPGLNQTTVGQQINNPPLIGKYVAVGQSRVFIFNLNGNPQDIIYSGYEQILLGRPEESFPPYNRLRLSIGAESIAGGAVLPNGVIAFSQTGNMYQLRGAVEDITLNLPANFSAVLQELPWTLGCASHFTIQVTPYGLIWLAGNKTVQFYDGTDAPIDISTGVYPLLQTIAPGTETQCISGYFNWLERDWYALLCCVNGSQVINRLFMFGATVTPSQTSGELYTVSAVEVFVSDIPTTFPNSIQWIGVLTNALLQRQLCVAGQGFIWQLPVSSTTVNGITQNYAIQPATAGQLNAYWRGGYFGNDTPYRSKTFRWARLLTDNGGFQMQFRLVDDEQRTFQKPQILGPFPVQPARNSINTKAKRCSVEIDFPAQDAEANVLELSVAQLATADR